jgi:hypothetical protein
MDPMQARQALDEALDHLTTAEAALARAEASLGGVLQDATAHARHDVQHTARKLENIARLVRLAPVPVRVDRATVAPPAAAGALALDF